SRRGRPRPHEHHGRLVGVVEVPGDPGARLVDGAGELVRRRAHGEREIHIGVVVPARDHEVRLPFHRADEIASALLEREDVGVAGYRRRVDAGEVGVPAAYGIAAGYDEEEYGEGEGRGVHGVGVGYGLNDTALAVGVA